MDKLDMVHMDVIQFQSVIRETVMSDVPIELE